MGRLIAALLLLGSLSVADRLRETPRKWWRRRPGSKGAGVYATTECTQGNADGVRCDKKLARPTQRSDCNDFASKCIYYGHQYDGTRTEGTCARIAQ